MRCALKALERRVDTVERLAQKAQLAESQATEGIAPTAVGIAVSGIIGCLPDSGRDSENIKRASDSACDSEKIQQTLDTVGDSENIQRTSGTVSDSERIESMSDNSKDVANSQRLSEPAPYLEPMNGKNSDVPDLWNDNAQPTEPSAHSLVASGPVLLRSRSYPKQLLDSPTSPTKAFSAPIKDSPTSKEGLEVYIGRHLNKLGISFLVIGCALALIYQFQYFSPLLKIISGLLGGALLILGGERFEKNNAKLAWYGRALIGGGWVASRRCMRFYLSLAQIQI